MGELSAVSGLPIKLEGSKVVFGEGMRQVVPNVRTWEQIKTVFIDKAAKPPEEFYFMYRNVMLEKDNAFWEKNNLRYDITVIPFFMVGKEFDKTLGHFHAKVPGSEYRYPEVYEVLQGTAHYLFQNDKDVIFVEAKQGDKVVIPSGYGHITINPGPEILVMSNITESNFSSEYGPIKEKHGGIYFETTDGWIKNENYENIPEMRKFSAKEVPEFGLTNEPMYPNCINNPEKFDWLKNPEKYLEIFKKIY